MASTLDELKKVTLIVADTGDFGLLEQYQAQDSTTNPSLIYAASRKEEYKSLVDDAISYAKGHAMDVDAQVSLALDKVAVNFGCEILKIVPGRVSTEIDARLSYDTEGTIAKAREIIGLYKDAGVDKERILIKIASTWEGLQAARVLEAEGIHVNMTLMFSLAQAQVAAEAKATLISPFVGRIYDWYKAKGDNVDQPDPGVKSVRNIYSYYKTHGYPTIVMGASFRSVEQVLQLAGCDALTVSPSLLEELKGMSDPVTRYLDDSNKSDIPKKLLTEKEYRWEMCNDEMAHFKLAEGIRKFAADLIKLENEFRELLK